MVRVKEAAAEAITAVDSAAAALVGRPDFTNAVVAKSKSQLKRAPLTGPTRFALAVVLSFAISSLGRSFLSILTKNELANIAKDSSNSWTGSLVTSAFKLFGLAVGWYGGYDGHDLAALTLLSHGPATLLVSVFYGIRSLTAGAYLAVEVLSTFLPFLLLRQVSAAHSAAPGVPNQEIVADRAIRMLTSLQAGLVYSVVLYLASRTFLPTTLVVHFNGIPTIKPATDAAFLGFGSPTTQILSLLFGLAARSFIFEPVVTTPATSQDQEVAKFDPVNATLKQTVAWNLWGYTTRSKVCIVRTSLAMLFTAVGTYLDTALAINGVESYGAVTYAGIWVISALVTGLSLKYVGSI
ncbi:hypothetical protein QBC35DRAFT_267425 [Podospora australis]|uniref:Uncharacterized protein n=1 Tax=Podospora australis TaxID=1536484 RepID=A0AAN6WUL4_9PEZI|nr:hypothetical protein QBC35DRAFT_267425 [Podospora australis]